MRTGPLGRVGPNCPMRNYGMPISTAPLSGSTVPFGCQSVCGRCWRVSDWCTNESRLDSRINWWTPSHDQGHDHLVNPVCRFRVRQTSLPIFRSRDRFGRGGRSPSLSISRQLPSSLFTWKRLTPAGRKQCWLRLPPIVEMVFVTACHVCCDEPVETIDWLSLSLRWHVAYIVANSPNPQPRDDVLNKDSV